MESQPYNPTQVPYNPPLGPHPTNFTCQSCGQKRLTEVRYENATKTHLFAALICLLGGICCFCIPYCVDGCKSANHYCGNCHNYVGTNAAK